MGNKLTERTNRLRYQRIKWKRQVEIVESYWNDCADEDRDEMRSELRQQSVMLDSYIEASKIDDATKSVLRARLDAVLRQLSAPLIDAKKSSDTGPEFA